jgi:S1-C subfamily serine protease
VTLCVVSYYKIETDSRTVPEKIMETVVFVNGSSGIIVHSDNKRALILTAYHTVANSLDEAACSGCEYDIDIFISPEVLFIQGVIRFPERFEVTYVDVDIKNDLALIEVTTEHRLDYAKIQTNELRLGEDIYIASNPDHMFRSLKKGIVGSLYRFVNNIIMIEISGGIIFGSSGGGIFDMNGQLIAIIQSIKMHNSGQCFGVNLNTKCITVPLTFIGFASWPYNLKSFLLNGVFSEDFKYLME